MQRINWGQAITIALGASLGGTLTYVLVLSFLETLLDNLMPGWYFSDLLVYLCIPIFDFLLIIVGAAVGARLAEFIRKRLTEEEADKSMGRRTISVGVLGASIGGLVGNIIVHWAYSYLETGGLMILRDLAFEPITFHLAIASFIGALLGGLFTVIVYMVGSSGSYELAQ